jgi:outer membrane protein assembly factor BamB
MAGDAFRARARIWLLGAFVGGALLAGGIACSDDTDDASGGGESVPIDDPVPPEVVAASDDWPLPGRDYANTRAVPDSPITSATVDALAEVWQAPLEGIGSIGNAATTPLILGDRVVVQSLDSAVRVFDRDTGDLEWETTVEGGTNVGPNGVAVGWGRVYAAKGMREIFALDLTTGDELWSTEIAGTPTTGVDIQPQVLDGLVLVSTVPISLAAQYTGGDRGVLMALDAETGEEVWRFDTVADDLWGNPEVNSGGGAWFPPSVDVESGIVYWGIANPAPFPGTEAFPNGSSRPGANLYTDSVVALDVRSGELLWYRQVIEHDLFDRDHVHTMIVDTPYAPVLVSSGKSGIVFGHDIETGDILWETQVGVHRNDDLTEIDGPTEVWPGTFGGVISPPSTADGVVYVATLNAPTELSPDIPAYIGSEIGTAPGAVAAVDATSGDLLWSTEIDGDPLGGATVVGDLVFTATFQERIYALSRATGEIVWDFEAPGGINGWPAVADDLIVWPVGLSDPPALLALALPH